ncbi:Carboxylic ester hydrolase [Pleurostoma richardsiae]|uniref:Carboxylic ester hydrolase n=1 Tax=Pleurostoma richardsiae TaxID=41990 RepID=A0AA38RQ12_9PEZI|nr:Carboxylic ester hydrolase [Pleurostoma richardsiae]
MFLLLGFLFSATIAACLSPAYAHPRCSADPRLSVRIAGGVVHGTVDAAAPAVRQFLGIPFAKAPLGSLRFAPPEPALPFGELDATTLPPSCMQYLSGIPGVYTREVLEFNLQGLNTTGTISEDCLTLGVWTPVGARKGDDLPVLIFIYGGGFQTGGIDVPYQLPPQWVQRTQEHIVVSFNYRLNIFGFPSAAGLEEQNIGLLDQRLAVEWVRDNIAEFGGNPARIGLWGQSAGSMSVAFFSFAHYLDPIVHTLLMDSGTELSGGGGVPLYSNFSFVAGNVGCGDLAPREELACMRSVPADEIENFLHSYNDAGTTPTISFWPVADGSVVFANYTERALEGKIAKLPAILGTNAQDGNPFAPYNPSGINQTSAEEALLSLFFCPSFKSTRNRLAAGLPTFRYQYFGNFSNISPKPWMGAYHSSELPMLFGTHPLFRGKSTELEWATSHAMQDAWLTMVRDGPAGLENLGWPAYTDVARGSVRNFGNGVSMELGDTRPLEAKCS